MSKREKPEYLIERAESIEARAAAEGCVVLYPKPNELFIDLDNTADEDLFYEHFNTLCELWPAARCEVHGSRGGHKHAVVTLPEAVTDLERAALQAAMGSDRKRELLTILAVFAGISNQTVFFELP